MRCPREQVLTHLRSMVRGDIRPSEPLSRHTSFRVGGPVDLFVRPADTPSLEAALRLLEDAGLSVTVFGLGTNILVRDGGVRGAVISTARLVHWQVNGCTIVAEAGASLPLLAREAARRGLSGLEFAVGIPGTAGGAVVMNAGAHGHSLGDVLKGVETLDAGGRRRRLEAEELRLEYRSSALRATSGVITRVEVGLQPSTPEAVAATTRHLLEVRRGSQPRAVRSAGCFFRNPELAPAGWLIEQAGCKGLAVGGAQVSPVHANFIVNRGGATARDILTLAEEVRQRVAWRFGVWLEAEVEVVGEDETA